MRTRLIALAGAALLAMAGCAPDEGDAREELDASMAAAQARFAALEKVIDLPGEVQTIWDVCGSAPVEALSPSIGARVPGEQTATIEKIRDRLEGAGWRVDSDVDNEGLRSITMVKGGDSVELTTSQQSRRGGADWSIRGECVRVPGDLANEKLDELP